MEDGNPQFHVRPGGLVGIYVEVRGGEVDVNLSRGPFIVQISGIKDFLGGSVVCALGPYDRQGSPESIATVVEQAAGITNGQQVYDFIMAGSEAAGAASGIMNAKDPIAMIDEMIAATRRAADDLKK